jgi:integrase
MTIIELPTGRFRLQIRRKNLSVDKVYATEAAAKKASKDHLKKKGSQTKAGPTLDAVWELYQASLGFKQKKAATQRSELTHIKEALRRFGERPVAAISPMDIEAMIIGELGKKKAADTIRNAVAALSAVLRFCVDRQIIARNPCIGVPRPKVEKKLRRMAPGDEGSLMAILNHPKLRYRSAARLCLLVRETGARPGEWAVTRWQDIDLDAQKVTFPNTKYKSMPRTIPLTNAAVGLLGTQLEDITLKNFDLFGDTEFVFPTIDKNGEPAPLRYSGTVRDMKEDGLLKKHVRAHSGRHEYISKLVEDSDIDDSRIMALVGHHSPTSMQIYAHARNVRFRGQLEALEPARRGERAKSFSEAAGLPKEVIDAYLANRRKLETEDQLTDTGDELLFTGAAIKDLKRAAKKLGSTESERMQTLLRIRTSMAKKRNAEGGPKTVPRLSTKRAAK